MQKTGFRKCRTSGDKVWSLFDQFYKVIQMMDPDPNQQWSGMQSMHRGVHPFLYHHQDIKNCNQNQFFGRNRLRFLTILEKK